MAEEFGFIVGRNASRVDRALRFLTDAVMSDFDDGITCWAWQEDGRWIVYGRTDKKHQELTQIAT